MKILKVSKNRLIRWYIYLLALVGLLLAGTALGGASTGSTQASWSSPSNGMALRQVSDMADTQNEPNFLSNTDCSLTTYRLSNSSTMRTGCFTATAFGWIDSDNEVAIFNGTDEGLPLIPSSAHEVLVPWAKAGVLVALDAIDTGGSYISLYKNPTGELQDQRDFLGQLSAKQLRAPPELPLVDETGQRLVVNPQTMAFSDNGSWLVVETLGGSFVRINLATLEILPFAPAITVQGNPALLKSRVTVSDGGRYVAIQNDVSGTFKVYDLSTCDSGDGSLRPRHCQSYDYWPFVQHQVTGINSVRHLRFVNDGLLSFEMVVGSSVGGTYELAPAASINSLTGYIGLGDSYTAGEGAFDYESGTDTADDMCHLSVHSYPLLLTNDLFGAAGGHSVACSGAVINDIGSMSDDYKGQVRGVASVGQLGQGQPGLLDSVETNFIPGYIAQQAFIKQYQPRVVTVSIGGNDIGFGDILQNCVEPHLSLSSTGNTCYSSYEDRMEVLRLVDRTVPRWTALYRQLTAEAPGTTLYVVGYPQVVSNSGSCGLNVHLSKPELEFAEDLIDYLNQSIAQAAAGAGVQYVDISQALVGHRLCEASGSGIAVNGLTAGTDAGPPGLKVLGKESYHPNAFGQALMEQAILRQTHNLAEKTGGNNAVADSSKILAAPKTGRTINTLVPDDTLTNPVVVRGNTSSVTAKGLADGLQTGTTYLIRLDGGQGTVLGAATSDTAGNITTSVVIPSNGNVGGHTIDITGLNQAGEPVDVTQPIYVTNGGSDSDGDGIPDSADSCPAAANSRQDTDSDGVDDVCDGMIGQVSDSGTQNGSSIADTATTQTPGSEGSEPIDRVLEPAASTNTDDAILSGSVNIVADFTVMPAAIGLSAIPTPMISSSTVLGVQTHSPANSTLLSKTAPTIISSGRHRPMGFGWLFWTVLASVSWLGLVLVIAAGQSTRHRLCFRRVCKAGLLYILAAAERLKILYNSCMLWIKKCFVGLLSLVLLISLLGIAFSASSNAAFSHPAKLENWLNQSKVYDHFTTAILNQTQSGSGTSSQSGPISLNDPVVQQIANSAFPPQALQQDVNTFLNSNYSWLEGKTAKPNFNIDLTQAKQTFAQKVGNYVQNRLAGLPVCTDAQLAQFPAVQNINYATITCMPPTLNAKAAGEQAAQEVANNSSLLSNPVFTADSVSSQVSNTQGKPYYQKFSYAPKLYRLALKLPLILGVVGLLSMIGIIFVAPRKRRGVRRIAIVAVVAGLILIAVKFAMDSLFNHLKKHLFNSSGIEQFQQSLTDFLHRIEIQLVKTDFWFGIALLALAVILFAVLWFTRQKAGTAKPSEPPRTTPSSDSQNVSTKLSSQSPLPVFKQPAPRPKKPRLIQ